MTLPEHLVKWNMDMFCVKKVKVAVPSAGKVMDVPPLVTAEIW